MKPLNRKNYGSIPHLLGSKLGSHDKYIHEGQHKIMTEKVRDKHDVVYVTEKYDGSNVGVAKVDNKIFALTRSGYVADTSKYKQHHLFNNWVKKYQYEFMDLLNNGERVCGEWLAQTHSLKYSLFNERKPIVFFDLFNDRNQRISYSSLFEQLNFISMPIVRLIHCGTAIEPHKLLETLNNGCIMHSVIGDSPEGMVYRIERKGKVDFLAKWVRSDFEPGKYLSDNEEEVIYNINV